MRGGKMLPLLPLVLGGIAATAAAAVAKKVFSSDDSNYNSNYDEADEARKREYKEEYKEKEKKCRAYIEDFKAQMKEKYEGEVEVEIAYENSFKNGIFINRVGGEFITNITSAQCTSLEQSIKKKEQERETFQALLDKLNTLYFEYEKAQVPTQVNTDYP